MFVATIPFGVFSCRRTKVTAVASFLFVAMYVRLSKFKSEIVSRIRTRTKLHSSLCTGYRSLGVGITCIPIGAVPFTEPIPATTINIRISAFEKEMLEKRDELNLSHVEYVAYVLTLRACDA